MPNNTYPGVGPTTYGFDPNYFTKITVSNGNFGQATPGMPDAILPFIPRGTIITMTSGSGVVEGCWGNVNTVHFELSSTTTQNTQLIFYENYSNKLYLRVQSGSTGSFTITVVAWKADR